MKFNLLCVALFVLVSSTTAQAQLNWRVQQLHKDNNEGVAVGDINGDGKLDVTAGEFWYMAPDFKQYSLRSIEPFGTDYLQTNAEHLYDVDGDGDLDVIAGGFTTTNVNWFENPGPGKYDVESWKAHKLVNTGTGQNETTFMHDIDGDGKPEFIENSWGKEIPMQIFQLERRDDGFLKLKQSDVSKSGNGHGMGFGDIDGDGLQDIIFQNGWYQQPASGAFEKPWNYHHDFDLPQASCPIIVVDLNDDGRNDLIWGDGHNYGLYWQEQLAKSPEGKMVWKQHVIDKKFSQAHALAWEDVDNDGEKELITGKRYFAHSGKDAGAHDEITIQYYDRNPKDESWTKHIVSSAPAGEGPGTGLQIRVHDLDDNGWKDIVVAGKSGTHIIWNDGE